MNSFGINCRSKHLSSLAFTPEVLFTGKKVLGFTESNVTFISSLAKHDLHVLGAYSDKEAQKAL